MDKDIEGIKVGATLINSSLESLRKSVVTVIKVIPTLRNWEFDETHQIVRRLYGLGIRIFRINLKSCYYEEQYLRVIDALERITKEFPAIQIMIDIDYPYDSPRIRVHDGEYCSLCAGEKFLVITSNGNNLLLDDTLKHIYISQIGGLETEKIIYKDGTAVCDIQKEVSPGVYEVLCKTDCKLWNGRAVHFWPVQLVSGANIQQEIQVIKSLDRKNIFGIALSFAHEINDIENAKRIFGDYNYICKIEDFVGARNVYNLSQHPMVSAIYVGRGDLLLSTRKAYSAIMEQLMIERQNISKDFYIGTDILESLRDRIIPSRSDINDILVINKYHPTAIVLSPTVSYAENFLNFYCQN